MFRKVAFVNAKGGVGKSTLATLTSLSLASRFSDSSVALLDLDKQATSSKALRSSKIAAYPLWVAMNSCWNPGCQITVIWPVT